MLIGNLSVWTCTASLCINGDEIVVMTLRCRYHITDGRGDCAMRAHDVVEL
jgi:hypothetical protein